MNLYTYDDILFPLPPNHRFPLEKYRLLREHLQTMPWITHHRFTRPTPAGDADLLLAHTPTYIQKVVRGTLSAAEVRRIGLPWSPQLVERCRHSVGATIAAGSDAQQHGVGISLGGGTHHATRDNGQGFCVFNDVVIAARRQQQQQTVRRVLVIDCDVHQGNGTAEIVADDPTITTFSIHGEKNFPFRKIPGDIDIGLSDGTNDAAYLEALQQGLTAAVKKSDPELIFYLAGADVHENDRLGRLNLTCVGIAARDIMVFNTCLQLNVPVVLVMAGGYGRHLPTTVRIQTETIRLALQMLPRPRQAY